MWASVSNLIDILHKNVISYYYFRDLENKCIIKCYELNFDIRNIELKLMKLNNDKVIIVNNDSGISMHEEKHKTKHYIKKFESALCLYNMYNVNINHKQIKIWEILQKLHDILWLYGDVKLIYINKNNIYAPILKNHFSIRYSILLINLENIHSWTNTLLTKKFN